MADFLFFNDHALSILKQHYTQSNGNDAVDDDTILCLSKASILQSIQDRIQDFTVPDEILDSLILLANLDRRRGVPPSDAMREAFCAVAVHVTLRYLHLSRHRYFDAVQRVWGLQIKNLEESGSSGLLSPGLDRWRNEIEESLWDKVISQRLSGINTLVEALQRIRVYLGEAHRSIKLTLHQLARPEPDAVASDSVPNEGNGTTARPEPDAVASDYVPSEGNGTTARLEPDGVASDSVPSEGNGTTARLEPDGVASESVPSEGNGTTASPEPDGVLASEYVPCEGNGTTAKPEPDGVASESVPSEGNGTTVIPEPDGVASESVPSEGNGTSASPKPDGVASESVPSEGNGTTAKLESDGVLSEGNDTTARPEPDGVASDSVPSEGNGTTAKPEPDGVVASEYVPCEGNGTTAKPKPDGVASESVPSEGNVTTAIPEPDGVASEFVPSEGNGTTANLEPDGVFSESVLSEGNDKTARPEPDGVASDSVPSEGNEIPRADSQTSLKQRLSLGQPKGVVVAGLDENMLFCSKNGTQSTAELEENRLLQLPPKARTADSLSEEVEEVETVSSDTTTKTLHAKAILEDSEKDQGSPTNHSEEPSEAKEGNEAFVRAENVRSISIMDRNDTAHIVEWVDSIDDSAEGTNETTLVLKKSEPVRRKVRWTEEEEKALMEGVREYGTHWKTILESYREILGKRNQVDLKDKWRNMSAR